MGGGERGMKGDKRLTVLFVAEKQIVENEIIPSKRGNVVASISSLVGFFF